MRKIDAYKNESGKLISFTWPGGYPMFYITRRGDVLCPDCASEELKLGEDSFDPPIDGDTNWEDPTLYCDVCNERIESAYTEDEVSNDAA